MPRKKFSFYLVDSDPETIESLSSLLTAEGHRVRANADHEAALREIAKARPDCVATNLMAAGPDGLEFIRRLKDDAALADTKVLVVSAHETDRRRAFALGVDAFIAKPINEETFIERVNRVLDDTVDMTFWGVRGTLPVPGEKTLKYGGNTSCASLEFPRGQFFIFDGGSGIKALSDHLLGQGRRRIEAKIFITHPHWDHINALPFFAPLYMQGNAFDFYGSAHGELTMEQLISAQMDGVYFPITIHEFAARVSFTDLTEETVDVDGIAVSTMLLSHPGYCLGYRVDYNGRRICYVTDNELFPEESEFHDASYVEDLVAFIKGADALITDCTYSDAEYAGKVGWGHSSVSEVVDLAHRAEVAALYLFHHDPDQTDADIDAKLAAAEKGLMERQSKTRCVAPRGGETFKV